MRYYPILLDIQNTWVLVFGGGNVALQKIEALLEAKAKIRVISPTLNSSLKHYADTQQIDYISRPYRFGDLNGNYALVFSATNNIKVNEQIYIEAKQRKILFNAVDQPKNCNFIIPAKVKRGSLLITISTEGLAPGLSKWLRQRIEKMIGEDYALLTEVIASLRKTFSERGKIKEFASFLTLRLDFIFDLIQKKEFLKLNNFLQNSLKNNQT